MEVPVQQIWRVLANFALVRMIFLLTDTANQSQLLHKPLGSLMIQGKIVFVKFCCNTAITVSTFVFMIDGCDFRFNTFIFVRAMHSLEIIVKGCTGQLGD